MRSDEGKYFMDGEFLNEIGISIQLDEQGRVLVVKKHPPKRGLPSTTLYRYLGENRGRA